MSKIKVIINGEDKELDKNTSVKNVLDTMNIKSGMFVVEKNLEIVEKSSYETCLLNEGDKLEIVGFFGGG